MGRHGLYINISKTFINYSYSLSKYKHTYKVCSIVDELTNTPDRRWSKKMTHWLERAYSMTFVLRTIKIRLWCVIVIQIQSWNCVLEPKRWWKTKISPAAVGWKWENKRKEVKTGPTRKNWVSQWEIKRSHETSGLLHLTPAWAVWPRTQGCFSWDAET